MAENILNVKIKQRYDTEANWSASDPILLEGECAYSSDKGNAYKQGNGTAKWSELSYNTADKANQLTTNAGSATQPIYFSNGKPTKCTYTLNKSVPSNAIFTDTTYSDATTSKAGLMPVVDKQKSDATNIAFGTCSTAAATADKTVTISGNINWKLTIGSIIYVKFTYTNTAQNPTLNVNETGAKNILYNTAILTTSNLGYAGTANRYITYVYDGEQYVFAGWSIDSNTTYSAFKGATSSSAGSAGLVPAPASGSENSILFSSGAWVDIFEAITDEEINTVCT